MGFQMSLKQNFLKIYKGSKIFFQLLYPDFTLIFKILDLDEKLIYRIHSFCFSIQYQ